MLISNISNLQFFKLFVRFVEGNMIVMGSSINMMKSSKMHY